MYGLCTFRSKFRNKIIRYEWRWPHSCNESSSSINIKDLSQSHGLLGAAWNCNCCMEFSTFVKDLAKTKEELRRPDISKCFIGVKSPQLPSTNPLPAWQSKALFLLTYGDCFSNDDAQRYFGASSCFMPVRSLYAPVELHMGTSFTITCLLAVRQTHTLFWLHVTWTNFEVMSSIIVWLTGAYCNLKDQISCLKYASLDLCDPPLVGGEGQIMR